MWPLGFPSCSPLCPLLQPPCTLPMFQLPIFLTHTETDRYMNTNGRPGGDPLGKAVGNYLVLPFSVQRRG